MNIGHERLMHTKDPRKAPLAPLEGMLRVASSCSSHCFRYGSRLQHCSWHAGGSVPNVKKGLPTPAKDHQLGAGLHCTWPATAPLKQTPKQTLKQTLKDHHRAEADPEGPPQGLPMHAHRRTVSVQELLCGAHTPKGKPGAAC